MSCKNETAIYTSLPFHFRGFGLVRYPTIHDRLGFVLKFPREQEGLHDDIDLGQTRWDLGIQSLVTCHEIPPFCKILKLIFSP